MCNPVADSIQVKNFEEFIGKVIQYIFDRKAESEEVRCVGYKRILAVPRAQAESVNDMASNPEFNSLVKRLNQLPVKGK